MVALQNSHTTIPKAHPEKLCRFMRRAWRRYKKRLANASPVKQYPVS
nr:MAG TPA: hypothetical protein [Caudoviricetes sp.]